MLSAAYANQTNLNVKLSTQLEAAKNLEVPWSTQTPLESPLLIIHV